MARPIQEYILWCADHYLSLRPRSEYEMTTYLMRKCRARLSRQMGDDDHTDSSDTTSAAKSIVDPIITQLKDDKRIDDTAYTQWYISEKNYFKPRGRMRLRFELAQKGVDPLIIEKLFEESPVTDLELIKQLIETRFAKVDLTDKALHEKVIRRLQQKGFSYSDIQASLQSAIEESLQKE